MRVVGVRRVRNNNRVRTLSRGIPQVSHIVVRAGLDDKRRTCTHGLDGIVPWNFHGIEKHSRVLIHHTLGAGDNLHAIRPVNNVVGDDMCSRTDMLPNGVGSAVRSVRGVEFYHAIGVVRHADAVEPNSDAARTETGRAVGGNHQIMALFHPFGIEVEDFTIFRSKVEYLLLVFVNHFPIRTHRPS